jgi:hypothetical protein
MTVLNGKPTFGAGRVFMTGNYTNPTPARAIVPQSQAIDVKRKVESLFGENQLAVAVAAGSMEVTGKVEYSKSNARLFADILFGATSASGSYAESDNEAGTVATSSPFTVSVANHSTFLFDLGVKNTTTGQLMTCVAAASEVAGKSYSLNTTTGVYTFNASDSGASVSISYAYTVAATGETISLTNALQGNTGNFQAVHVFPWASEQDMIVLYSCIASSAALSAKQSAFGSTSLDYTAGVNGSNVLGVASFAESA